MCKFSILLLLLLSQIGFCDINNNQTVWLLLGFRFFWFERKVLPEWLVVSSKLNAANRFTDWSDGAQLDSTARLVLVGLLSRCLNGCVRAGALRQLAPTKCRFIQLSAQMAMLMVLVVSLQKLLLCYVVIIHLANYVSLFYIFSLDCSSWSLHLENKWKKQHNWTLMNQIVLSRALRRLPMEKWNNRPPAPPGCCESQTLNNKIQNRVANVVKCVCVCGYTYSIKTVEMVANCELFGLE